MTSAYGAIAQHCELGAQCRGFVLQDGGAHGGATFMVSRLAINNHLIDGFASWYGCRANVLPLHSVDDATNEGGRHDDAHVRAAQQTEGERHNECCRQPCDWEQHSCVQCVAVCRSYAHGYARRDDGNQRRCRRAVSEAGGHGFIRRFRV